MVESCGTRSGVGASTAQITVSGSVLKAGALPGSLSRKIATLARTVPVESGIAVALPARPMANRCWSPMPLLATGAQHAGVVETRLDRMGPHRRGRGRLEISNSAADWMQCYKSTDPAGTMHRTHRI